MLKQYLQQICQELTINDPLSLSGDGFYCLSFDGMTTVQLKENQDLTIFFQADVAPLPKKNVEDFLLLITGAHLFGKETGKAFFGLDGKEENLILSQLSLPRLGYAEFRSELEDYLNYVEAWREETAAFSKGNQDEGNATKW